MKEIFEILKTESAEVILHNIQFGIYEFTHEEYFEYCQINDIKILQS